MLERILDAMEQSVEGFTECRESEREVGKIETDVPSILCFVLWRCRFIRNSNVVYPVDGALEESISCCMDERG